MKSNNTKSKDDESSVSSHASSTTSSLRSRASSAFKRRKRKDDKNKAGNKQSNKQRRSSSTKRDKIQIDSDSNEDGCNPLIAVGNLFSDSLYFLQCFCDSIKESMTLGGTAKKEDEIADCSDPETTTTSLPEEHPYKTTKSSSWISKREC